MRLTTKELINNVKTDNIPYLERYKKLSQLEDIEDELGIDLIIIFKALKNGCWIRKGFYGTCYLEGKAIFIPSEYLHLNLYDYYTERKNESNHDCN